MRELEFLSITLACVFVIFLLGRSSLHAERRRAREKDAERKWARVWIPEVDDLVALGVIFSLSQG